MNSLRLISNYFLFIVAIGVGVAGCVGYVDSGGGGYVGTGGVWIADGPWMDGGGRGFYGGHGGGFGGGYVHPGGGGRHR